MGEQSKPGLVLRANIIKVPTNPPCRQELQLTVLQGRNLAAKDRSGTSDPVCASSRCIALAINARVAYAITES